MHSGGGGGDASSDPQGILSSSCHHTPDAAASSAWHRAKLQTGCFWPRHLACGIQFIVRLNLFFCLMTGFDKNKKKKVHASKRRNPTTSSNDSLLGFVIHCQETLLPRIRCQLAEQRAVPMSTDCIVRFLKSTTWRG